MKIRPVGAELVHADGRTDGRTVTKTLIVAFRNFTNAPKNQYREIIAVCSQIHPEHTNTLCGQNVEL